MSKNPPIINAPPIVSGLAITLIAIHGLLFLAGARITNLVQFYGGLMPQRFWEWVGVNDSAGGYPPYANGFEALATLITTGFLHADWMHVLMNSIMLVAVGKPVFDTLRGMKVPGQRLSPEIRFVLFFLVSVIGGSVAHLLAYINGDVGAIGASGGVCGLIGGVLLLARAQEGVLLTAGFFKATAAFLIANIVFAFAAPYLFGMNLAWEAHIGGYLAGALLMMILIKRRQRYAGEAG